ncbi:TRAP transporter large permease subunit [Algiphilus sp.]|uniref:TRAP transporter large permease n=1 Tax=Algiphilus sp. TaxID=1872431 RepID=UPI002A64201F|nr:TRAP transporter large permease subunit [Pseudomonadota bacterium]
MEWIAVVMFVAVCATLLVGYPVAFTLAGVALWFAGLGVALGALSSGDLLDIASRVYGTMTNVTLMAVPLFVFMGVMLERSKLAEQLLQTMAALFGRVRGGLLASVVVVGALLAASTGIVGATVVAMGLISLPTLLERGVSPRLASGAICASGTLGQVIPPSIVLVLLGDVLSAAYQQAQLRSGVWSVETVSVGDLFAGALIPGLVLVVCYVAYVLFAAQRAAWRGEGDVATADAPLPSVTTVLTALLPPVALIILVLGTILGGYATATEAAGIGAAGAVLLAALKGRLNLTELRSTARQTVVVTAMVFMILLGASTFSMVFNAYGGDALIQQALQALPGGAIGALVSVMVLMFFLGFVLDFIEIVFVVVPIVAVPLLMMGLDPIWLGILMAMNLQTSFLTPPFGFALFYLRGVAPPSLATTDIYRGAAPFIGIQVMVLMLVALVPVLATWLPGKL